MVFVSGRQRKKVMALLSRKGFDIKPKKISAEGNFYRARLKNPKSFQPMTFRTLDVGKKGGIKLIRAKPKDSSDFQTQAILVEKKMM